jgi:hypothetical protein
LVDIHGWVICKNALNSEGRPERRNPHSGYRRAKGELCFLFGGGVHGNA